MLFVRLNSEGEIGNGCLGVVEGKVMLESHCCAF